MSDTTSLLAALERVHAGFGELLAGLAPDQWATTVPACPEWSVADLVAHVTDGERVALESLRGEQPPGLPPDDVHAWTRAGVDARRGTDRETLLADWEAASDALRWQFAALEGDEWRERAVWVFGPVGRRALAQLRMQETWVHGRDIAGAVGRPVTDPDPELLGWLADLAVRVLPGGLARFGRTRPGTVVEVRLGGREWRVGAGPGRPDPGTAPALTIEADPLEFVLLATGRRDRAAVARSWRVSGDEELAADVAATISSVGW
jgi:uncharacterized protein (TIGR03083 family)